VRSGALDDGQERAEETAATLTGTSVTICYADGKARSTVRWSAYRARLWEVGSLVIFLLAEQRRDGT
jgi:hypothetical protein